MAITLGLDVGSTYTKAVLVDEKRQILGKWMQPTGHRIREVAEEVTAQVLQAAGLAREQLDYIITTGFGRHQIPFRDLQVTDLTATARGTRFLFPNTHTVLDIGGQTMKASRLDAAAKVQTFRLNDKCASGTGAFLEKTVRYMGYKTEDIGPLLKVAKQSVPISGVCAVFAESEVINHLSNGVPPEEIMYGSILSLVDRAVQLMRRIKAQPEFTLVGGILRWQTMAQAIQERLGQAVNVPGDDLPQFTAALGCALLGQLRLKKLAAEQRQSSKPATAPA
ncbi:MAG: 2-hydroxyglutaryl-CoA dehydratase [Calditrichaeota bacterium]|nr:MAG: 2-hydroxyglutaryl-CoA dehydratase [Calditrichota bacterium]